MHKRLAITIAFMVLLGGCSVSPTLDAASWTVGGVSYLITGKGAVDHAVSAAAGQDCAMMRMIKNERVCVPLDEDVAGDRLTFRFEPASVTHQPENAVVDGDPLRVNPAIAEMVAPLGDTILVQTRSAAVAAVAADAMAIHTLSSDKEPESWSDILSGLSKDKAAMPLMSPDYATRLWLPVE